MKSNEYETYDITDIVVEKAFKILLVVCRIKGVKCNRISFSFRNRGTHASINSSNFAPDFKKGGHYDT